MSQPPSSSTTPTQSNDFRTPVSMTDPRAEGDLLWRGEDDSFYGFGGDQEIHLQAGQVYYHALIRHPERTNEVLSIPLIEYEVKPSMSRYMIYEINPKTKAKSGETKMQKWNGKPWVQSAVDRDITEDDFILYGGAMTEIGTIRVLIAVCVVNEVWLAAKVKFLYNGPTDRAARERETPERKAWMQRSLDILWKHRMLLPELISVNMDTGELQVQVNGSEGVRVLDCQVLVKPRINRPGRFLLTPLAEPVLRTLNSSDFFDAPSPNQIDAITILGRPDLEEQYRLHPELEKLLGPLELLPVEHQGDPKEVVAAMQARANEVRIAEREAIATATRTWDPRPGDIPPQLIPYSPTTPPMDYVRSRRFSDPEPAPWSPLTPARVEEMGTGFLYEEEGKVENDKKEE